MTVITDNFVERLRLGDKMETIVRDSRLKGFAIRARRLADGSVSKCYFVMVEDRPEGGVRKRRKVTIGDSSKFTADAAREVATQMLQSHAIGDDPARQRKAKKEAPTFSDLAEMFIEHYLPNKKARTASDYCDRIKRRLIPAFGKDKVAAIDGRAVRDFVKGGKGRPTDTNRCLAVLSSMMSYAVEEELRRDNPCIGVRRYKETARDVWIDELDMPAFIDALDGAPLPYADLLRFLVITGWRISEARELRWDVVDLRRGVVHLGDTKTGAQDRQLSEDAVAIVKRQLHSGFGYVFSKTGRAMLDAKYVNAVLKQVCLAAGIAVVTAHALRHTAATWSALAGAPAFELRDTFGWSTLAMANRYVSKAERLARRGVERTASAIDVLRRSDLSANGKNEKNLSP
ncbi:MAG: tyrosine-type recombinase/integrase [Devosia sp.]